MIRVGLVLIGTSGLGNVNYYRNLLNAIYSLPERQIEPVLFIGKRADPTVVAGLPPIEVVRSRWFDLKRPGWAIRKVWQQGFARDPFLERFLKGHRIDVLSHSDFLGPNAAVPAICWIGDFQHRRLPQFFKPSERRYRDRDILRQGRYGSRLIVSSFDVKHDLEAFAPVYTDKIRVLQFVAQPTVTAETPDRATLEARYGFNGPYLHLPNQFWAHKNHRLVIDALSLLKQQGKPILVIATGSTRDRRQPNHFAELIAHAEGANVMDYFKVLGVIPYADVVGLMCHSVALVNPSRAEGWSTSVEEAKSLGKRIILSDLPVHREQAPEAGCFIDLDDAAGLANAMWNVWSTYDSIEDQKRMERARSALPDRIRAYGRAYQDIVLDVVEKTGQVLQCAAAPAPTPT